MKLLLHSFRKSRRGIALLTVLALLTLTAVLILAFFSISQTELRSTTAYAGGAEAQQLAKTAVDMVMHQIRAATEDSGTAWASQPGAIRVWGPHQGQETVAEYKLYSDDEMTLRAANSDGSNPDPTKRRVPVAFTDALFKDFTDLKDWDEQRNKDTFVDLNEPILRSHVDQTGKESVKVYYPIVDPRAYVKGSQRDVVTRDDWSEPSVAREDRKREVEGFFFETKTVSRGKYPKRNGSKIDHFVGLPMPVKWIYQLKDGTLGTLDRGAIHPKFNPVSGEGKPSQSNPMVARLAFWTDDETCKLNVNTSAGGFPWDTPRAGGRTDREEFGLKQPVQKEFQRYPGHPATTSLAPVLFPFRTRAGEGTGRGGRESTSATEVADALEKIYGMVPRIQPGGSGARRSQSDLSTGFWGLGPNGRPKPIDTDSDRLYATIDEFIFHATKKSSQGLREPQEAAGSWGSLDGEFLDRVKFFLTTSSRAPELTVFNTPRISVWPSYYEPNYATYLNSGRYTKFDKQIRFCAEVGSPAKEFGHQYHFQRKVALSDNYDYDQIPRNQELFSYLMWLMKQRVPGVGLALQDKYGDKETQQIATEIFDYIRSTDLFDDMIFEDNRIASRTKWGDNVKDHYAYTNNRVDTGSTSDQMAVHKGHGQVTPIEIKRNGVTTKGFGRAYSVNEVGIAFIATAQVPDPRGTTTWPDAAVPTTVTQRTEEELNPTHLLGGKRYLNWVGNDNGWSQNVLVQGVDENGKTGGYVQLGDHLNLTDVNYGGRYDYTNVPPFGEGAPPLLPWDGHPLDPGKAADAAIIAGQQWVAQRYDPLWTYKIFEEAPATDARFKATYKLEFAQRSPKEQRGSTLTYKEYFRMKERWNYIVRKTNWNYSLVDSSGDSKGRNVPLKNYGDVRSQAILLFSMFCPSFGWTALNPDFQLEIEVDGNFKANGRPLFDKAKTKYKSPFIYKTLASGYRSWRDRPQGGILEPSALVRGQGKSNLNSKALTRQLPRFSPDFDVWKDAIVADSGLKFDRDADYAREDYRKGNVREWTIPYDKDGADGEAIRDYPWVSDPFTMTANATNNFEFQGGKVQIKMLVGGAFESTVDNPALSQVIEIKMEDAVLPKPICAKAIRGDVATDGKAKDYTGLDARSLWCFAREGCFFQNRSFSWRGDPSPTLKPSGGRFQYCSLMSHGDDEQLIQGGGRRDTIDGKADVVRSYVVPHGDYRLLCARRTSAADPLTSEGGDPDFVPHEEYKNSGVWSAAAFSNAGTSEGGYGRNELHTEYSGGTRANRNPLANTAGTYPLDMNPALEPSLPTNYEKSPSYQSLWGDWDNPCAAERDGAYINKPDEGNSRGVDQQAYVNQAWAADGYVARQFIPYYTEPYQQEAPGPAFFSPNRMVPGPGMFGSLPTGIPFAGVTAKPWQTLLFRPLPNQGRNKGHTHPGYEEPKDHYLLDFFWMPVVEPWSVSEPFSTAGKVNMNYVMQPFYHIKRTSGVLGVMFSEQMLTVPADQASTYKGNSGRGSNRRADSNAFPNGYDFLDDSGGELTSPSLRSFINYPETLKQFEQKLNLPGMDDPGRGDLFKTASELCELWLVPEPVNPPSKSVLSGKFTLDNVERAWDQNNEKGFTLTGDNSRERPYTNLIPRLTTKSNTFQIHYRAQIIKQAPTSPNQPGERRSNEEYEYFDSDVDGIVAEYRGSTVIERYIDPNEAMDASTPAEKRLPDYAKLAHSGSLNIGQFYALDRYYRFRVVSEKRFSP